MRYAMWRTLPQNTHEPPPTPPPPPAAWARQRPETVVWMNVSDERTEGGSSGVPVVAEEVDLSLDPEGEEQFFKRSTSEQNRSSYLRLEQRPFIPLMKVPSSSSAMKLGGGENEETFHVPRIWKRSATRSHRSSWSVKSWQKHPQSSFYADPVGKTLCDEWSHERLNLVGVLSSHCLAIMCDRYSGLLLLTALSHCSCTNIAQDGPPNISGEFQAVVRSEEAQSNRSVRFLPAVVNQSSVSSDPLEQSTLVTSSQIIPLQDSLTQILPTVMRQITTLPDTLPSSTPYQATQVPVTPPAAKMSTISTTKNIRQTSDKHESVEDINFQRTIPHVSEVPITSCGSVSERNESSSEATTVVSSPWRSILNPGNHNIYFGAPSYEAKFLKQKMGGKN